MASLTTAINYMDPTIYGSKQAILLGMQGSFQDSMKKEMKSNLQEKEGIKENSY